MKRPNYGNATPRRPRESAYATLTPGNAEACLSPSSSSTLRHGDKNLEHNESESDDRSAKSRLTS